MLMFCFSFAARSVLVCCNTTEEVEAVETPAGDQSEAQCGVSSTRTVFNFNLRARQAVPADSEPRPPVVGGQEARVNSYPWMAGLGSRTEDGSVVWFCGGSYIGQDLILTAAHCVPRPG